MQSCVQRSCQLRSTPQKAPRHTLQPSAPSIAALLGHRRPPPVTRRLACWRRVFYQQTCSKPCAPGPRTASNWNGCAPVAALTATAAIDGSGRTSGPAGDTVPGTGGRTLCIPCNKWAQGLIKPKP